LAGLEAAFRWRALIDFGLGRPDAAHDLAPAEHRSPRIAPKVAVLLIGTNNNYDTPEDIAAGVKAVIAADQGEVSRNQGDRSELSLYDARATAESMAAAKPAHRNAGRQPCPVFYLDLRPSIPARGRQLEGFGRDKLHLTAEGVRDVGRPNSRPCCRQC